MCILIYKLYISVQVQSNYEGFNNINVSDDSNIEPDNEETTGCVSQQNKINNPLD